MRAAWQRTRDAGIPFDVQWGDIDYMDRSEERVNESLRPPSFVGANTGFNKGEAEKKSFGMQHSKMQKNCLSFLSFQILLKEPVLP